MATTRKITPAQRRALLWLVKAPGDTQKASHWMIGANVSAQTVHNLHRGGLIRVVSRSWDNSIDMVRITAPGRAVVAQQHQWLKTKYYPVDVSQRVIYDDPQRTEGKCSLNGKYRGHHTIGVKGARISEYAVYQTFIVKAARDATGNS